MTTQPTASAQPGATGRVLTALGVVLAVVVVGFGALFLVDLMTSETSTTHRTYDAVDSVELVADGAVTVRATDGDIEVDAIAHSGLREPGYAEDRSADRLELTHRCGPPVALPRCSGDLDVTVPAGTEVVIRTENGDVVASGLAGALSARTANGDIEVTDSETDVETTTSNGDISVTNVGGTVTADSSNGRITISTVSGNASATTSNGSVEVSAVGGDVHGESSNGRVTVVGDGEPVALTISTSNGDEVIEGPTNPDAERSVEIRTSNGDVAYLDR